jgi:hypothetical protein
VECHRHLCCAQLRIRALLFVSANRAHFSQVKRAEEVGEVSIAVPFRSVSVPGASGGEDLAYAATSRRQQTLSWPTDGSSHRDSQEQIRH